MGIYKPSKKLVEELTLSGTRARATVLKIARGGPTTTRGSEHNYDPVDSHTRRKTTVRVTTSAGTAVEVSARLNFRLGGLPTAGDDIPVIYDPADPDRMVVDEQAHLLEVTAKHGGPVEALGGPRAEIAFGDTDALISAAGYDPATVMEQVNRLRADAPSAGPGGADHAAMLDLARQSLAQAGITGTDADRLLGQGPPEAVPGVDPQLIAKAQEMAESMMPETQPEPPAGVAEQVERLAALHTRGALDDAELESAKQQLLDGR